MQLKQAAIQITSSTTDTSTGAETKQHTVLTFPHVHIRWLQQRQERCKQLRVNLLGLPTFLWNKWYTWSRGQKDIFMVVPIQKPVRLWVASRVWTPRCLSVHFSCVWCVYCPLFHSGETCAPTMPKWLSSVLKSRCLKCHQWRQNSSRSTEHSPWIFSYILQ